MKRIKLLKVSLDQIRNYEISDTLSKLLRAKNKSIICTVNSEILMNAQADAELMNILNRASSLNLIDGCGLQWAYFFLNLKEINFPIIRELTIFIEWIMSIAIIPFAQKFYDNYIAERTHGSDFVWKIAEFSEKNQLKVFLLGGSPTVPERAALQLQTKLYNLKIAGTNSDDSKKTQLIIDQINKTQADILLVAYGAPKQEKWLNENMKKTCAKIGIGLGGTFDFLAGTQKRSPLWIQKINLEWFYRLIKEPKRIIRQTAIIKLLIITLIEKLKKDTSK